MSYLGPLRLHFAGAFQASVSTVNNDPSNFAPSTPQLDPGFNPEGDGDWRLIGCKVTSAWSASGAEAAPGDPALGLLVADAERRGPAKIADLDPQQQMVSMIFGLQVRLCRPDGRTLLRAEFEPAPFADVWARVAGATGGNPNFGAAYQSVLTDLRWSDDAPATGVLAELRAAATDGLLSIKFNVDGYDASAASATFTRGRITGTLGPASADEPRYFVAGRQLLRRNRGGGALNFAAARLDAAAGKLYLDLGNAFATTAPGGPPLAIGPLAVSGAGVSLGAVELGAPGWYARTAGVVVLPADRALSAQEVQALESAPLAIDLPVAARGLSEAPDGRHVRADASVFRLDPGDPVTLSVVATRFGAPWAGQQIGLKLDPRPLDPATCRPASALHLGAAAATGPDGRVTLSLSVSDPGEPRGAIDGQVYGVRPALAAAETNPSEFVSLLVHSGFVPDEPPTWHGSLAPIFEQYADLYPIMRRFLALDDYESVCANAALLRYAFALPLEDPNTMPVTRDLSSAKRAAILRWLSTPGPDGRPLAGVAGGPRVRRALAPAAEAAEPQGKDAGLARRIEGLGA